MREIDDDPELTEQIEHHYKHAKQLDNEIRGSYLHRAIVIDYLISDIVSNHFCSDREKTKFLFSVISKEVNFSRKIRIFKQILEACYPDLSKKYKNLSKELNSVGEFRNKIAHAMLDSSQEFLEEKHEDRIQLIFYSKGKEEKLTITLSEKERRIEKADEIIYNLTKIQTEVYRRNPIP